MKNVFEILQNNFVPLCKPGDWLYTCVCVFFLVGGRVGTVKMHWLDAYAAAAFRA